MLSFPSQVYLAIELRAACGTGLWDGGLTKTGFTKKHGGSLHKCVCVRSDLFVVSFRIISSGQMKMHGVCMDVSDGVLVTSFMLLVNLEKMKTRDLSLIIL